MTDRPRTVREYLASLPAERRKAIEAVRKVIRANLDPAYEEGIQYGMIGYYVPHRVYPAGYHCDPSQPLPFASVASQKNHMAVYLFCVYTEADTSKWFQEAWKATGKKLDVGKSCVRFKKLEDVALDVIGEAIRRAPAKEFIARYEEAWGASRKPAARSRAKAKAKVEAGAGAKTVRKKAVAAAKPGPKKAGSGKASGRKTATRKKAAGKQAGARKRASTSR